jgi:hypothetical protein
MRFTRTACLSALTVAAALSTVAPALAAPGDGPRCVWSGPAARRVSGRSGSTGSPLPRSCSSDPRTGRITWIPGEPEFHGWECQPILLRPVQP